MKLDKKKLWQLALLVLSVSLFIFYFANNRDTFTRLGDLSLLEIAIIIVGQLIVFTANCLILIAIGNSDRRRISVNTSARVTAYSSIINFFGFLQGGVGFRGFYLKKYFSISYKKYFLLTTIQYLLLFGISAILVLTGISLTRGLGYSLAILAAGIFIVILAALSIRQTGLWTKLTLRFVTLRDIELSKVIIFTPILLLQLVGSGIAYATALHAVGANLTIGGLLIFVGVSQFAIVFALTPGAIGIREGLLLIVQGQMLLSTSDIVLVSTLDRLAYFITLAIITPLALTLKQSDRRDVSVELDQKP